MKVYALCPICGHKLLKAIELTDGEIKCPRCSHFLKFSIKNGELRVQAMETEKETDTDTVKTCPQG